jgi:hypothetical protein
MGLTTNLGLHSQTTRLCEAALVEPQGRPDGALTLYDDRFHGTWGRAAIENGSIHYNSPLSGDFHDGLFPVRSPLLGESWLVSFPPLIDMLKFSG